MSVTAESPFVAPPRISKQRFATVLRDAGSPWADRADAFYDLIARSGHDPAVWLAICGREHSFATNRNSVLWRNDTKSWTNARTVRHPGLIGWTIITDSVRGSQYVKYASVEDSLLDGMYRITDPTFRYVKEGRTTIAQVFGIWTESEAQQYTEYVVGKMNEWIGGTASSGAQIPGFVWHPADSRHHTPGRTKKIAGFAVHYTGGTNSLEWLTTHPNTDVSATFLIKHNPTLEDRGWQLVRIEDTPHTTGSIVNPFTVSFEYEQLEGQAIPAAAYDVMAQTILDSSRYVADNNLGAIPLTRSAIKGHKEWVGDDRVCPDGIEVNRVVQRTLALAGGDPPKTQPATIPDPWGSPLGEFWIAKVFVDYIKNADDWMDFGYCCGGARMESGLYVQYFQRARLELHPDGSVHRGLIGQEMYESRYGSLT